MTRTLRIGIVGTGVMGQDHARCLATGIRGATLTAIADINEEAAQKIATELGVPHVYNQPEAMITSGEIDALIIASPDQTHVPLLKLALEQKLPTLCEKPLAPTASEGAEIVALERTQEHPLITIGFMRRFDPGYIALREHLQSGDSGQLLMSHSVHRNVSAYPGDPSSATVTNSAVHEIDILPWLSGHPITHVQWTAGRATTHLTTRHDPQFLLMWDSAGILHTVELMVQAEYGYDVRCELVCESGTVELPPVPALVDNLPLIHNQGLQRSSSYPADWRPRFAAAYRAELSAWVEATLKGEIPAEAADTNQALQATLVAEALVKSMENQGERLAVPSAVN